VLCQLENFSFFLFLDGNSPPGSVHSADSVRDKEKKMPKLFARLQHRAQLMKRPEQEDVSTVELQQEREEDDGRLTIVEPSSHGNLISLRLLTKFRIFFIFSRISCDSSATAF
jgi:hypothetical protein